MEQGIGGRHLLKQSAKLFLNCDTPNILCDIVTHVQTSIKNWKPFLCAILLNENTFFFYEKNWFRQKWFFAMADGNSSQIMVSSNCKKMSHYKKRVINKQHVNGFKLKKLCWNETKTKIATMHIKNGRKKEEETCKQWTKINACLVC